MNVIAWKKTHLCSKLAWIAICAKHLGTTAVHFRRGEKKDFRVQIKPDL
jgi:hypothetical protein